MTRPNRRLAECSDTSASQASQVAESVLAYRREASSSPPWTDTEIAAIRCELSKLTALRVPNTPDVEDIVQDTLLALIRNPPLAELEKGALVWSLGILRNKIGNYYRHGRRHPNSDAEEPDECDDTLRNKAPASPECALLRRELQKVIEAAIKRLPTSQRRVMELLFAGHNPGEIVEMLSPAPYQTVINHLYRGRRKIALALANYRFGADAPGGMHSMKRSGKKP
ncbi:MAG: sigma-70 family RNA polymerase sigma factor [Acidobacteriota bacterium]|nr:sigma-70 family RNA polymerase sigma factor [Acidobacteriota bacterium]